MPGAMSQVTSTACFVSDSATTDRMKSLVILAVLVAACQASTFKYAPPGKCSYPTWNCVCELIYNCDGNGGVPDKEDVLNDAYTDAGFVKDLAPSDYELRIPGKRWRREIWNSKEFCKIECYDRMNAFLCLDDGGKLSDYSSRAICSKLLYSATSPFTDTGAQDCCGIFLKWGLGWCPQTWIKEIGTVGCLQAANSLPTTDVGGDFLLSFFSSIKGCDSSTDGSVDNTAGFCQDPNCDVVI